MTEQEALARMVAPGTRRPGKYREGVIQVWVTRACDQACFGCTQGSNLGGKPGFITVPQFREACRSLKGYFGVVGMFGGNPAIHPQFVELCAVMAEEVPREQRGLWCNNPLTLEKARAMRETFNPAVSNLNVHLDGKAYAMFKEGWPECGPVGLHTDSRHSPPFVAMKDVLRKECQVCGGQGDGTQPNGSGFEFIKCSACDGSGKVYDEARAWELISRCDINIHWSAMIGVFRGQLRAWFCEVAGAQAMLHQDEPAYPDTGLDPNVNWAMSTTGKPELLDVIGDDVGISEKVKDGRIKLFKWWELAMPFFADQVRKHCHECSVPLRGWGELAQAAEGREQTSATHEGVYRPKRPGRQVEVVTGLEQLGTGRIEKMTKYLQNSLK